MRLDVANLLERLGRRDFHYQEFADRFTDVELWPIFETLIRDPRIIDMQAAPAPAELTAATPEPDIVPPAKPDAAEARPAPSMADLAGLFARYGGAATGDAPTDVHALLQRLAQQIEEGKL